MPLDFKKILSSRFLFTLGTQMQAVIVGWQMYILTHDPLHLGLIGLAEAVPAIGIALYAGYIVDRSRPLRVYGMVLLGSLLSALVVFLSQTEHFVASDHQRVIALYLASFLTGTARAFAQPALFAIVPRIVPRAELAKGSAWSMSAMQVARVSGPAVGGLVFGWLGVGVASALVCVSLLLGFGFTAAIQREIPPPHNTPVLSIRTELMSGAQFVFTHPVLLPALSLDMISVFFGGVTALLPIYASDILQIDARGLGLLRAAPAVGAAITGIWLTRADIRARAGGWLFTAVTGFGVSILIFGLSHSLWLSLAALALSGAFDSVSMVVRATAVQLVSPDKMRGRISAVNSIFIGSSNELGEFESGLAARFFGVQQAVLLGAGICLATVAGTFLFSSTLRRLDLIELGRSRDNRTD
ncbi:MAG: MFS transporter [Bdellovibrionota bacterium]